MGNKDNHRVNAHPQSDTALLLLPSKSGLFDSHGAHCFAHVLWQLTLATLGWHTRAIVAAAAGVDEHVSVLRAQIVRQRCWANLAETCAAYCSRCCCRCFCYCARA
jgi:hypothetical protein